VADSSRHFLLGVLSECTEFLSSTFIVIDVSEHQGGLMTVDYALQKKRNESPKAWRHGPGVLRDPLWSGHDS